METATELLTRTESCKTHGEYISTRRTLTSNEKSHFWSRCPTCEDEQDRRSTEYDRQRTLKEQEERAKQNTARLRRAGIELRFENATLDSFEADTPEQKHALEAVRGFVEKFPDAGRGLILCGGVGTGKTHLAVAAAHIIHDSGKSVRVVAVSEIVRRLRDTWRKDSDESTSEVYKDIGCADLLVLDEVGASICGDREIAELFPLFNARYNAMRPTIVISNLDLSGLTAALGERVIDRLRENRGQLVTFSWQSFRRRKPPEEMK